MQNTPGLHFIGIRPPRLPSFIRWDFSPVERSIEPADSEEYQDLQPAPDHEEDESSGFPDRRKVSGKSSVLDDLTRKAPRRPRHPGPFGLREV